MRVLHVIPSVSANAGGPSFALKLMESALSARGIDLTVLSTDDDGTGERIAVQPGIPVSSNRIDHIYFPKQTEPYKLSWPLRRWLRDHVGGFDLVHVHALFSFSSVVAAREAGKAGVPYVIRPLGVLNRYGMIHRRPLLKWLSFRLVERSLIRRAAAMHYTSSAEQDQAESLGIDTMGVVVPLGIDTSPFESKNDPEEFYRRVPVAENRSVILFLSRIDPKKGLDLLLPAFAEVVQKHPRSLLVVAGEGPTLYVEALKAEAERLGITEHVCWPGFFASETKISAFAAATVYVLPSYSENFGIALVEAMASGLASVTTDRVGIASDLELASAALVTGCSASELGAAIDKLLRDGNLRDRLGSNAVDLVRDRYSLRAMGDGLINLYESILDNRGASGGAP